jgi:DNA-binding MarR family transcriptional regulator
MLDRLLTRLYDDALDPVGLRANQLTMLSLIASMNGLKAVDVGHFLEMDKSTVSRGLAFLREKGWVDEAEPAGRGRKTLVLTGEGAGMLSSAMPYWRAAGEEAEKLLGETSIEALRCAADSFLARRARS